MKTILTGLFLLINITCFSQTVKKLEKELSSYTSDEGWGNKKDIAYKLLGIDGLNEKAINYLVEVYSVNNKKDSINILFERLIKDNPKSPVPYLIRAQERNANYAGLTFTQKINYLKEAYKLDNVNEKAIFSLGRLYYDLFVEHFKTYKKKEKLDDYSSNAIKYFSMLFNQVEKYQESLTFPLIQLANYAQDIKSIHYYENYKIQCYYFPLSAFVDLPKDWKTNYTVNVFKFVPDLKSLFFNVTGVEPALMRINWYDTHLKALDEPVLRSSLPGKVFRFTWLRSFHNPIVIRLECVNNSIILYWKVCNGKGGYEPGKIIKNKKKTLTSREWNDFVTSIDSIDFWNLSTTESGSGSDGARWILEGIEPGKYHVVDRWSGGTIEKVCLKLLELTNLKIKQDDIY